MEFNWRSLIIALVIVGFTVGCALTVSIIFALRL